MSPAAVGGPGTLASVTTAPPRPGKRAFTGRAAILAVVLLGLLLTVAYPVQEYLRQRADLAALHAQRDSVLADVQSLQSESARWDDPAFVKQQAKERLYFVAPGEKTFVIIGAPEQAVPASQPRAAAVPTPGTWYERVWSTVNAASQANSAAPAPTPAIPSGTARTSNPASSVRATTGTGK
ncbi:MAG: hypothetical protein QOG52_2366 [Frankiaceae bacterium]|nr:hypothetical protein [Frankiaceae bacterium]MDQ1725338.1 hypothetical protein [Frankiaceae bacterium]